MKRFKGIRYLLCLISLVGVLGILLGSQMVFAAPEGINPAPQALPNQDEPPADEPVTESLELVSRFPVKQGESGGSSSRQI